MAKRICRTGHQVWPQQNLACKFHLQHRDRMHHDGSTFAKTCIFLFFAEKSQLMRIQRQQILQKACFMHENERTLLIDIPYSKMNNLNVLVENGNSVNSFLPISAEDIWHDKAEV